MKYFISINSITWQYIESYAPWWGEICEWLMKGSKEHNKKQSWKGFRLLFEDIINFLSEMQLVMNHRPFTFINYKIKDAKALIPAPFFPW